MSGVCGWAGHAADEESRKRLIARMAEALAAHDGSEVTTSCTIGCAIAAASLRGSASALAANHMLVAIAGDPVWHDGDLAALAARDGHAAALAAAYAARGPRLLDALGGSFALAVVREGEWEALLAVDRFATIPLDYAFRHGCLVFGTHPQALLAHPRAESEVDPQAICSYLFHGAVAAPGTVHKNHRRLLPGHRLLLKGGRIAVEAYFRREPVRDTRPHGESVDELRRLATESVARAGAEAGVLLDGEGGAAVAALLAKVNEGPPRAFSAGAAAKATGDGHHAIPVAPEDVLGALPRVVAAHADPLAADAALPSFLAARAAAEAGVPRLLSGAGGPELFGATASQEAQAALERHARLPGLLRAPYEALLVAFPGARRRALAARVQLPERLHADNPILALGARNVFTVDFLKTADTEAPMRLVRHVWSGVAAEDPLDRVVAHDRKFVLADAVLPAVSRACELAGVSVAFPLLDDGIAALAARLPADARAGVFRSALVPKGGAGAAPLPLGAWLRSHRGMQQLAGDSLSELKGRGIVRPAFVDEVVRLHAPGNYHGAMVWRLILLEQWFRVHAREPAPVT